MPPVPELAFYLINALAWLLIFYFGKRFFVAQQEIRIFYGSLVIKGIATCASGLLFLNYFPYTTDSEMFVQQATLLHKLLQSQPEQWIQLYWANNTQLMYYAELPRAYYFVKLLSLLHFLTADHYWLDGIWLSIFCFWSAWYFCKMVKRYFPNCFFPSVIALLWIPTTTFWTAGVLKETIVFSFLCLLGSSLLQLFFAKSYFRWLLVAAASLYVLAKIKFYVVAVLVLVGLPFALTMMFRYSRKGVDLCKTSLLYAVLFAITFCVLNWFSLFIYHASIAEFVYYNYVLMSQTGNPHYSFTTLTTQASSFLPYFPEAMCQGLFMPLPWNAHSFPAFLESTVNTTTCLLIITILWVVVKKKRQTFSPFTLILLVYVLVSAIAFGLSTPNWGTLARYKIMYVPFLHLLLLTFCWKSTRIKRFFVQFRQFQLF